jgi:hypothetical protein
MSQSMVRSSLVCFTLAGLLVACGSDDSSDSVADGGSGNNTPDSGGGTPSNDTGDGTPDPGLDSGEPDDGTRYPVAPGTGVVDGTFTDRLAAAFDGDEDQTVAESAVTPLFEGEPEEFLLYREFNCLTRLQRLEIVAPSDGPFVYDEQYYPNGGTGELRIVGRRTYSSFWETIATVPYGTEPRITVLPEALQSASEYVGYGIVFDSSEPVPGQIRVAEVKMYGFCTGPEFTIAWDVPEFQCEGVECVTDENPGGTQRRDVRCLRDDDTEANEQFCPSPMPAEEGDACALACPYELKFIGYREFTYDNESGWLHEGLTTRRAGPLPSETSFGATVEAVEGKPCSVLTTNPLSSFMAISCLETPAGDVTRYCSFRCEAP